MVKIQRFEEIEAWRVARELTRAIYSVTSEGAFSRDFALRDQIRRAAISVMSNIAEGFDSGSKAEFIHFLSYARRSASEVQSHLYVVLDQGYIAQEVFSNLYEQTQTIRRMVTSFMKYLRAEQASRRLGSLTREPANPRTRALRSVS